MADEAITYEKKGRIAIITINLPKKLGAMTHELYFLLTNYMIKAAEDEQIKITILTGTGRFFSAGADVTAPRSPEMGMDERRYYMQRFVSNNLNLSMVFYSHPKILITALNGPVIGLSAAIIAYSDFIYATPHTYLLTPFSSLGLVAEGGASRAFVNRLGLSKANEALIMSKRLTIDELVSTGFVNKVFDAKPGDTDTFMKQVLQEVDDRLGLHLNQESLLAIKALIRRPEVEINASQNIAELVSGMKVVLAGIPQEEFRKIAMGEKRHKL